MFLVLVFHANDDCSALAAGALALKISLDTETVLFAILDIFSQGVFGYWIIMAHDSAVGS